MARHEATFEVASRTDAHSVSLLTERIYDAFREELGVSRRGDDGHDETLDQFAAIREAASRSAPGRLTVVYERDEAGFDDR